MSTVKPQQAVYSLYMASSNSNLLVVKKRNLMNKKFT